MESYPNNSHKYKEQQKEQVPEKKIEKVITGTAKTKKRNRLISFSDIFGADDMSSVASYVLADVIIPKVKDVISAAVSITIDTILYGEGGHSKRRSTADKISYNNCYDSGRARGRASAPVRTTRYNYDDIIVETRGEAEAVLSRMDEIIDQYGMVSVADLFELCDMTGQFTDHKYGWTDLSRASVERTRDGFTFKLPRALPLN